MCVTVKHWIQISIDTTVDKKSDTYSYNGILCSSENEWITNSCDLGTYIEWKSKSQKNTYSIIQFI